MALDANGLRLVNKLFTIFSERGWQIPKELPDIFSSEKTIQLPLNKNGLRGYWPLNIIPPTNGQPCSESCILGDYFNDYTKAQTHIIVYEKVLEQTAKKFSEGDAYFIVGGEVVYKRNLMYMLKEGESPDYGISYESALVNLRYCIILHELIKWIIVDVINTTDKRWEGNPLDKKDHLHETLSMYFLSVVCKYEDRDLRKCFTFLYSSQTRNYLFREFEVFQQKPIDIIIRGIEVIRALKLELAHETYELFKLFEIHVRLDNLLFYDDIIHIDLLIQNEENNSANQVKFNNLKSINELIGLTQDEDQGLYETAFIYIFEKMMNATNANKWNAKVKSFRFGM